MSLTRYGLRHTCLLQRHIQSSLSLKAKLWRPLSGGVERELEDNHSLRLYETHIATTTTQKVALSLGSAFTAITDPYRDGNSGQSGVVRDSTLVFSKPRHGCGFR